MEAIKPFPDNMTIGEKYGPAMEITDPTKARVYFEACVEHHMRTSPEKRTREEVERIERQNLGYYAGYYSHETRERVERLFLCEHPVFGAIAGRGTPEGPCICGPGDAACISYNCITSARRSANQRIKGPA